MFAKLIISKRFLTSSQKRNASNLAEDVFKITVPTEVSKEFKRKIDLHYNSLSSRDFSLKEFKEKEIVDPGEIKKREIYWMSILFHTVTENRGYELYSEEAMEHVKSTHYIYLDAYKDSANKHIEKTGSMLSELVTTDGKFCGEISWYKDREPKPSTSINNL